MAILQVSQAYKRSAVRGMYVSQQQGCHMCICTAWQAAWLWLLTQHLSAVEQGTGLQTINHVYAKAHRTVDKLANISVHVDLARMPPS